MGRDVVVKPARTIPIQNIPVQIFCRCGREYDQHPAPNCQGFRPDKIKAKT